METETIIYVGGFELPDEDAAAHRVVGNAKILKESGYKIVLIDVNRSNNMDKKYKSRIIKEFDIHSIAFPRTYFEWLKYLTDINHVKETINSTKNIKAVICYNYPSILLYRIQRFCKKRDISVISDVTEWYEDKRIIKRIDTFIRMKYLNKKTAGVICISSFLDSYYKSFTNTVIVPPLIDLNDHKWDRINYKSNSDIIKLVYSGNPGKHKDKLNLIIESINEINDSIIQFDIVGITKEQYLIYYPEHKELLDILKDKITFLGRVSHKKSINIVMESDFQIFIRENKRVNNAGFPTKFVESMACGTPVITTRTSDLNNYLVENENGFFVDYDNTLSLVATLNTINSMKRSEIRRMKNYCLSIDSFDYRNYKIEVDGFLKRIFEKEKSDV